MINTKEEFVLDGFPRTLAQAEWLVAQHKAGLINISTVLHIEASEEVVVERLMARGRPDDTEESIAKRFSEYSAITLPIIKDFESSGITVHHIDGERSPNDVYEDILPLLK